MSDITVPLYDLEKHKIKRMVQFGGATFFEIDDVCSRYGGEPAGTLTLCAATSNTIFSPMIHLNTPGAQFFCIKLVRFDGQAMRTLDDLIELIPRLVAKGHFTVEYINHLSCPSLNCYLVGYDPYKVNIAYDSNVSEPMLFTFDPTAMSWTRRPILEAP